MAPIKNQSVHIFKQIIIGIDQLEATPPYPTSHVLAQLASMAYRDGKQEDTNPPEGWRLLK